MGFRNITLSGRNFSRSLAIGLLGLGLVLGMVAAYVPKTEAATTQYVKYSWSDRVYKVYGTTTLGYVTWSQYVAAGYPPISVVNWIPGTKLVRYLTNSDAIYAILPDPTPVEGHHLTLQEWANMGYRPTTNSPYGFTRVNNGPAVFRVPSCSGLGWSTTQLTLSQWTAYGYPSTVSFNYIPSCL